ncbi:MAG TPA: DUF6801 domain-containing protein [Pseudonocardiaceae bacterium]|nr:DUF6801 domain-containing protein [Pseudonocardiaceae bacterium]
MAAAGAVAGGLVLVGAGSASAAASLDLKWDCPFPPLADQTLDTNISVNLPATIATNTQTGALAVTVDATVPATATQGLDLVGGTNLSGSATAKATLNEPGGQTLDLNIPLTIPTTAIPQDGSAFTVHATGSAPSIQFATAGSGSVVVDPAFSMVLHITNASGAATSLPDPYNTNCTANTGQNMQLATFTVTGGSGGGTTTTTTTPPTTTTTTPPTSTTTTTTPPSSTTTTMSMPSTTTTTTSAGGGTTTTGGGGGGPLVLHYAVNGSAHLTTLGSDIKVGPGTLTVNVDLATGNLSGPLALPNNTTSFNLFGFVPGTAEVSLTPTGPVTGTFKQGVVNVDVKETVGLVNVTIFGGIPLVSNSSTCQTTTPSDIKLASGSDFTITNGGSLSGKFDLSGLNNNCGGLGGFISVFTQGTGNTLSVKVTPTTS